MNKLAVVIAVAAAPFLLAATVAQGNLYGRFNDGVYLAPGKLFRLSSPFPDAPIVSDGSQPDNNNAGAVSFIDETGRMVGVLYMEDKDKTIAAGEDTRHLADWFRDTGFPRFFQANVPDSKVLRDEALAEARNRLPDDLARALAAIHRIDPAPLDFLSRPAPDVPPASAELTRYEQILRGIAPEIAGVRFGEPRDLANA